MEYVIFESQIFRAFCDFCYACGDNVAQAVAAYYECLPKEYLNARQLVDTPEGKHFGIPIYPN